MAGKYVKVKCKCENEQVVFTHSSHKILCSACKEVLVEPQGGKANILGKIVEELE